MQAHKDANREKFIINDEPMVPATERAIVALGGGLAQDKEALCTRAPGDEGGPSVKSEGKNVHNEVGGGGEGKHKHKQLDQKRDGGGAANGSDENGGFGGEEQSTEKGRAEGAAAGAAANGVKGQRPCVTPSLSGSLIGMGVGQAEGEEDGPALGHVRRHSDRDGSTLDLLAAFPEGDFPCVVGLQNMEGGDVGEVGASHDSASSRSRSRSRSGSGSGSAGRKRASSDAFGPSGAPLTLGAQVG